MNDMDRVGDFLVREIDERPASPDGTCFYCRQPVGGRHADRCVIPQREVRVSFTVTLALTCPAGWSDETVGSRYNDSTWCADNLAEEIMSAVEKLNAEGSCLCGQVTAKVEKEESGS